MPAGCFSLRRSLSGRTAEIEKATAQLEKEKIKLKELQSQFDGTYNSMSNFIAQQDKVAKKAEETAKKMDIRQAGANMKVGADLATSGLRTLDQIAPGVAGNIGNIITQVNAARMAMNDASSAPMKWAMGLSAAIGVAVTLVVAGIQKMKEAEEERQRAFEEGVQKTQEYAEKIAALETNIRIIEDEKTTTEELITARDTLTGTFNEVIAGYDREGKAILANTELLKEQLNYYKLERESARITVKENFDIEGKKMNWRISNGI